MNKRRRHQVVDCSGCVAKETQLKTLRQQIALKDQDLAELRRQLVQSTPQDVRRRFPMTLR